MFDAKIASVLNKILQNSHFKKNVSLEEQKALKEDRFLRGRQIAFMIYDYFRVTGAHDTVLDYADYSLLLFMMIIFRNSIQDGMKFYYLKNDDVLESLYKLRVRASDQVKTVLELYDMEIHHEISMLNNHKLKTMVESSIGQKLRSRDFDARHGKIETGSVVKN